MNFKGFCVQKLKVRWDNFVPQGLEMSKVKASTLFGHQDLYVYLELLWIVDV